jgi:hypothetical protein
MTKLSHGCGWCFLPAVWAGKAALKFIIDIIIRNYPLYSDWLTELPNIFGLPGSGETSPDGWLGACPHHSHSHKYWSCVVKLPRGLKVRLERLLVVAIVWRRHKMLPAELR